MRSRSPRKFWLLAILPHTHVFRPRAHVGFCPGLRLPLLRVTPVKREAREKEPRAGWGGLSRAVLQRNPFPLLSLQDLWALPAVSLGWSVFDPQIRTSSQSRQPIPMALDSPSGAEEGCRNTGDEVCPLSMHHRSCSNPCRQAHSQRGLSLLSIKETGQRRECVPTTFLSPSGAQR